MTHAADEINTRAIKRKLVETSVSLRPTEVYTLDEELDRNPAHRLVSKRVRESILEAGIVLTVRDKRGGESLFMIQDMMDENLKHRGVDDGAWVILYRDRANVSRKDSRPLFLSRFPYALVFLELKTEIRVLAVAHAKRDPDYWLKRLQAT